MDNKNNYVIWLIDDDPISNKINEGFIIKLDPSIINITFVDAKNVMSLLNNNLIVLPNLIILDWYLPDYNGSDFLRDFSKMENFGKVKIVILSSTNDYSVIDEINRYNIRFLKKPLNLDKLKDVIGCSNDLTNVKNLLNFFSK